ncbi:hypothetical protein VTJ49DRAFT_5459 [Mycothermus thermophilus]|uniref:FAD-binding PCMH-type domain-containing protein n=1 Tax=Humicola insolens TaxID=85995 RepID=A0ABR3V3L7_HUMIN
MFSATLLLAVACVSALTHEDIARFPDADFGGAFETADTPDCKTFPGDPAWPSDKEWSQFNETLDGALLHPPPPASWPQGDTCPLTEDPVGICTRGGYPVYVVNATSVKHVQAAVNFARNRNIRLVIKFVLPSGAGSLSVWTHNLVGFQFLPSYTQPGGNYQGPAVCMGAGVQAAEALAYAERTNITLLAPNPGSGCLSVGTSGGFFMGGGHSPLTSKFGLGADQVLSIKLVTADGRYITADPQTNPDLFFALRGGGGGTYGIVTSVIVKAHPPVNVTFARFNLTLSSTTSTAPGPDVTVADAETFWRGVNEVLAFSIPTVDARGYLWALTIPLWSNQYQMQVNVQMPNRTPDKLVAFLQPLLDTLNEARIPVTIDTPMTTLYTSLTQGGQIDDWFFNTRLFPRRVFEDEGLFDDATTAIRAAVEARLAFLSLSMSPTLRQASTPPGAIP